MCHIRRDTNRTSFVSQREHNVHRPLKALNMKADSGNKPRL